MLSNYGELDLDFFSRRYYLDQLLYFKLPWSLSIGISNQCALRGGKRRAPSNKKQYVTRKSKGRRRTRTDQENNKRGNTFGANNDGVARINAIDLHLLPAGILSSPTRPTGQPSRATDLTNRCAPITWPAWIVAIGCDDLLCQGQQYNSAYAVVSVAYATATSTPTQQTLQQRANH